MLKSNRDFRLAMWSAPVWRPPIKAQAPQVPDNNMNSEKAIIELKDLSKIYQMGEENIVKALDNINLEIHEGEFVSIMGPSGSGKSTLMNILGCLDHPTSGQYFLDGQDVSHL